jgi:hypothetical protein
VRGGLTVVAGESDTLSHECCAMQAFNFTKLPSVLPSSTDHFEGAASVKSGIEIDQQPMFSASL